MMYPGTRRHGKSPRGANASDTAGFRCAPETAPMNRMIAITISPGATTAAARLTFPSPCRRPPPAAASTRKKRPEARGNHPPILELGVVELRPGAELEHQQALRPLRVVG